VAVFGLLHGAFEGAWVWEFLTPELHQLGHDAIAVDLPIDDIGGVREVASSSGAGAPRQAWLRRCINGCVDYLGSHTRMSW
jgi:hypothetical protein